ncbi:MAG: hypothetical protein QM682_08010 [Paracoccus sp. (in: a-proteobacteria)]|uniref:hypothetical protein n=1 Tax=Paracoccus sp. TaxID=267 RepID=UPI0039E333C9
MAAITHLCSLDLTARILDEDRDLLEAIIVNDDNLTCGVIVTVHTGQDEAITALTDDGIIGMKDMLAAARATDGTWNKFLQDFVSDRQVMERFRSRARR